MGGDPIPPNENKIRTIMGETKRCGAMATVTLLGRGQDPSGRPGFTGRWASALRKVGRKTTPKPF